jgi:hypothetical protein
VKADFSRLTYDELQHYVGVVHQQGRVWLDSDWNEDVFERLRLLEQETVDIVGGCGVPKPHTAFRIEPVANSTDDFAIRGGAGPAGHFYVDGILAKLDHDATYRNQPDFPEPPQLQADEHQQGIAYLEVWQRLITHLEDPTIQEIALGGLDTAARLRTIAQVKVMQVPGQDRELTCDEANRLLAPTGGGTLTTLQPADTPPDDDCVIPDPGSYTGRENHLYRVEVHDPGDVLGGSGSAFRIPLAADAPAGSLTVTLVRGLSAAEGAVVGGGVVTVADDLGQRETLPIVSGSGTTLTLGRGLATGYRVANHAQVIGGAATFKWSRDNAAFASAVTAVAADRVTLSLDSLGRDVITTLRDGDLVEVADDVSDLGPARGHLTFLAADPEADPPRVTLAEPLPTRFTAPGVSPDRRLKLRKWDGLGTGQAAFDPLSTPDMNFGDGVHIQFGGTDLRPGDYWTFVARRADGSVQALNAAPPQGIVRHRCALAIVRWRADVRYELREVLAASREADLGDVFKAINEQLEVLSRSGTKSLDLAEVLALAKAAGATDAQVERIRQRLVERGGERRTRFEIVDDCRPPFDPLTELRCDCECTMAVAPGESIGAAIGKVPPSGGTVCLLAGVHDLRKPIDIRGRRGLTIRGVGGATQIRAHDLPVAFRFADCDEIDVRDIVFMGGRMGLSADDRRRELIDALNAGMTPGTERAEFNAAEPPDEVGNRLGAAAPAEPAATDATTELGQQFAGLLTFADCRGIAVEGCSFLVGPAAREGQSGFGLVFLDASFLAGRLAFGVRSAVFAATAAPPEGAQPVGTDAQPAATDAQPVVGTLPSAAPAAAPAPLPAAPAPADAPSEMTAAMRSANPESVLGIQPVLAESPVADAISAIRAAMGDRPPSIGADLRPEEPVTPEPAADLARARPAGGPPGRAAGSDTTSDVVADRGRAAPSIADATPPELDLISRLATLGRHLDIEPVASEHAGAEHAAADVPVSETRFRVLTATVDQPSEPEAPLAEVHAATNRTVVGERRVADAPMSDQPVRIDTVAIDTGPTPEARSNRRPLDLTLRGCRFFVGGGQNGALVASAIGVTIADDWFAPLSAARQWGWGAVSPIDAASAKATGVSYGVILADDRLVTVRDNVIVEFAIGMLLADMPTGKSAVGPIPPANEIVGNLIASKRGLAVWAASQSADIVLAQNAFSGEPVERTRPFPITGPTLHAATVDVTADSVIAIGNRFGCGANADHPPTHSVGVQASEIVFIGNQSTCDTLPSRTNVLLHGLPRNERSGRTTAVSNRCQEPPQIVIGDFRRRFEEALARADVAVETRTTLSRMSAEFASDDRLVMRLRQPISGVMLTGDLQHVIDDASVEPPGGESVAALRHDLDQLAFERSDVVAKYMASVASGAELGPQLERLTANELSLAERIRVIEAANEPLPVFSLIATGQVSITGMNILSHRLARSGIGSDVGTVQDAP